MKKQSLETADFGGITRLIAGVRDADFDQFADGVFRLFEGSPDQTVGLARYLWSQYGPDVPLPEEDAP